MSSSINSDSKLSMSLEDLISAEKRPKGNTRRERSPRRSHDGASRFARAFNVDDNRGRRRTEESQKPRGSKTVKVTNVPYDLTWKDVKDAFQSAGSIERCDVDKGTAWITFTDPRDAQDAVNNYDGGDMNGRRIKVVLS
jgi:RNA recognition motif-containing protein